MVDEGRTILLCLSKAFTLASSFLLFRRDMRTWVWFLTACCKTDRGPWLISCSSKARSWASSSSDFGTWTYWLVQGLSALCFSCGDVNHLIVNAAEDNQNSTGWIRTGFFADQLFSTYTFVQHQVMGRLKQKGKAGAAKAYTTRSSAVKKLQISLADFRRLCILKGVQIKSTSVEHKAQVGSAGIFPREPRHRKRANKGSSAPTSFYYTKDIAYLAHEPVLAKLREHKAFAKKLSRALGRGEWSSAKSLEDNKPVYRLDHIIKER